MLDLFVGETTKPETNAWRVLMTPQLAQKIIDRNTGTNRSLSIPTIRRYARQITDGQFRMTHQGISLTSNGNIIDGAHRLHAIIMAGEAVWLRVFIDEPQENFAYVDNGRSRQALQFISGPNTAARQGAARIIGVLAGTTDATTISQGLVGNNASVANIIATVEAWPEMLDLAPQCSRVYRSAHIAMSKHLALMTIASRTPYAHKLPEWFTGLIDGAGLSDTDSRLLLRNRFSREFKALNTTNNSACWGMLVKAWNAFATNSEMRLLRHMPMEDNPVIIGSEYLNGSR